MTPNSRIALCALLLGLAGCLLGLWIDARAMLGAYLAAWFAVAAIPIGALGVLFTSYLVRAGWTRDLHEPLSNAALTLPMIALLFLPVLAGMAWIYGWAADASALPAFNAAYLTPCLFVLRTALYFAIWTALAVWAWRAYGDDAAMTRSASAGLIVWSLTVSWAGVDWLESVEPHFHSSIYGLLTIGFVLLAALGFALAALLTLKKTHQMSNTSYSGVLLSVLMLWAYLHAMQYIIIWTGNIPAEVTWYLVRLDHGWNWILWGLFIGQFIVPFFVLLSERARSSTAALLSLAGATLVFRVVEAAVLVLPPLDVSGWMLLLDLPAAMLATGASGLLAWHQAAPLWRKWSSRTAAAH